MAYDDQWDRLAKMKENIKIAQDFEIKTGRPIKERPIKYCQHSGCDNVAWISPTLTQPSNFCIMHVSRKVRLKEWKK